MTPLMPPGTKVGVKPLLQCDISYSLIGLEPGGIVRVSCAPYLALLTTGYGRMRKLRWSVRNHNHPIRQTFAV